MILTQHLERGTHLLSVIQKIKNATQTKINAQKYQTAIVSKAIEKSVHINGLLKPEVTETEQTNEKQNEWYNVLS